jgi:hypothetical protein
MKLKGKTRLVRRVVYETQRRPLQPGERVIMECGERLCILAAHMATRG